MAELIGLRQYHSKTHDNNDGSQTLEAHVGHIHYKDGAGDLQNVDLTFTDEGFYWSVTKANYQLYVAKDFDAAQLIRFDNRYEGANHSIYYRPHSIWWVDTDDKSERTKWKDRQSITGTLNVAENKITYTDAFGSGVHFEITLRRSGFTKELVIDSKPPTGGAPYTNWALGVVAGWSGDNLKIKAEGLSDWDDTTYYEYEGDFEIREVASDLKSYIKQAWGSDSSNPEKQKELPVFFEKKGGELWQGKLIVSSFVEQATYPIRVDTTTNYYTGAGDGFVNRWGNNASWNTTHDHTDGNSSGTAGTSASCHSWRHDTDNDTEIRRMFLPVDTSGLPDAATISAATLYVYVKATENGDNDGDDWVTVVQTSQVSTAALENADYDQCGAVDNPTEAVDNGDREDISGLSTVAYTTFPFNATGIGWIDKTGVTKLGMREGHDCLDDPVVGDAVGNDVTIYTSEQAGAANDPYLSVTYTGVIRGKMTTWGRYW